MASTVPAPRPLSSRSCWRGCCLRKRLRKERTSHVSTATRDVHRPKAHLGRAGVGSRRVVDHDIVIAGAASRQLPLTMVGANKVSAVAAIARDHNPYVRV